MSQSESFMATSPLENVRLHVKPSRAPPAHSSNIHGQNSLRSQGIRIVHEARPEGSGPTNQATRANFYLPYMSNSLAVEIKHARTSRGLGVFTTQSFAAGHRILREGATFSCIHPERADDPIWMRSVVHRWRWLAVLDQSWFKEHFPQIQYMPLGTLELTPHEATKFLCFLLEYAFGNPQKDRINVYHFASHINHACGKCANAEVWIQAEVPDNITVRLIRHVRKGQEIFINYNRPSGNTFGCAVCGARDGETSRFRQIWQGMLRRAHGVWSSYPSEPELDPISTQPQPVPVPTPDASVTAGAVPSATTEAPADAIDVSHSIEHPATVAASTDGKTTRDPKAPIETVTPVGEASSPETHNSLQRWASARWASLRKSMK
ncbi:hypothetical protein THAR02_10780 [Trichoderma harzianum]|uniref:SET domain-containing protein n=1 Tax=Trichoderma harzianum TaxID=5544 RepID=A0A0F9WVF5_TRIHA|nr:hypothetical protein THAR02_10780 [Trichoderma harzianum]